VKLLDRTRKGVVVREEAKALLAHIEQMDMQASSLEDAVAGARATQVVRIATMEGLASCYVARRLLALPRFAPGVRIELVSIPQTVDLSRKEADVFLSFFNPKARGLESALFATFNLFLYCSRDYARRHGVPGPATQVAGASDTIAKFRSQFTGANDFGGYTMQAYDAANALMNAIGRAIDDASGSVPSREQVRAEMAKTKGFIGVIGTYDFDANGDNNLKIVSIYEVKAVSDPAQSSGVCGKNATKDCFVWADQVDFSKSGA